MYVCSTSCMSKKLFYGFLPIGKSCLNKCFLLLCISFKQVIFVCNSTCVAYYKINFFPVMQKLELIKPFWIKGSFLLSHFFQRKLFQLWLVWFLRQTSIQRIHVARGRFVCAYLYRLSFKKTRDWSFFLFIIPNFCTSLHMKQSQ